MPRAASRPARPRSVRPTPFVEALETRATISDSFLSALVVPALSTAALGHLADTMPPPSLTILSEGETATPPSAATPAGIARTVRGLGRAPLMGSLTRAGPGAGRPAVRVGRADARGPASARQPQREPPGVRHAFGARRTRGSASVGPTPRRAHRTQRRDGRTSGWPVACRVPGLGRPARDTPLIGSARWLS